MRATAAFFFRWCRSNSQKRTLVDGTVIMSLSRLRNQRHAVHTAPQDTPRTAHLPVSVVDAFREHPLLEATNVSIRDVHACLVVMLSGSPPKGPCQSPFMRTPTACVACKDARIEIDHRAGDYVCGTCGVVQPSRIMEHGYQKPDTPCASSCFGKSRLPEWAMHREDYYWFVDHERELEHYNRYVNLSVDDMEMCKAYARKSLLDKRASPIARVVAALLLPILQQKVDLDALKHSMSSGCAIELPDARPPEPTHPCLRCGALTFSTSDARRHPCNWGRKRRRHR